MFLNFVVLSLQVHSERVCQRGVPLCRKHKLKLLTTSAALTYNKHIARQPTCLQCRCLLHLQERHQVLPESLVQHLDLHSRVLFGLACPVPLEEYSRPKMHLPLQQPQTINLQQRRPPTNMIHRYTVSVCRPENVKSIHPASQQRNSDIRCPVSTHYKRAHRYQRAALHPMPPGLQAGSVPAGISVQHCAPLLPGLQAGRMPQASACSTACP